MQDIDKGFCRRTLITNCQTSVIDWRLKDRSQNTEYRIQNSEYRSPKDPAPNPERQTANSRSLSTNVNASASRYPLHRHREMMVVYGRQRLRGTAALQVSCDHRCHQLVAIAGRSAGGRPLRRRRVSDGGLRPATAARDRRPPSLLRSSLPSADGHSWPICWRAPAPPTPCKR